MPPLTAFLIRGRNKSFQISAGAYTPCAPHASVREREIYKMKEGKRERFRMKERMLQKWVTKTVLEKSTKTKIWKKTLGARCFFGQAV